MKSIFHNNTFSFAKDFLLSSSAFCLIFFLPLPLFAQITNDFDDSDTAKIILKPSIHQIHSENLAFFKHPGLTHPKIGLALSGGGARCLSQIGVLQVLDENGFSVECIVGTSMGSLFGGLYAAGYSPKEIEQIAKSIDWRSILIDKPPRSTLFFGQKQNRDRLIFQVRFDGLKPSIPRAFTPGQKIQSILTELTMKSQYASGADFDNLRIPFRVVCTDLYSGEKVVLSEGDLAEAIRASLAFPLLFTAVPRDGKLLADGGLVDNIPVDEVRKLKADIVIAVDSSSDLRKPDQLNAPWEIADQVTSIMQRDQNAKSRAQADILIRIESPGRTNMDFSNIDSLIAIGRLEMAAKLPQLRKKIDEIEEKTNNPFTEKAFYITAFESPIPSLPLIALPGSKSNGHGQLFRAEEIISYLDLLVEDGIYRNIFAEVSKAEFGYTCKINVRLNPNLSRIHFIGNTIFSSDSLRSFVRHLEKRPVNHRASEIALENIIAHYRKSGYALAKITNIEFDENTGNGSVFIDEGQITSLKITGTHRTKNYVIAREFPQKQGDIFNFREAQRGINNIFGTGLFDRVSYSLDPQKEGAKVSLKIQEKKYTALGLSGRIDSERKSQVLLEISDENIAGIGAKFAIQSRYGAKDRGLRSTFSLERIFKTYLTFDAEVLFSRKQNFVYEQGVDKPIGEYFEKRIGAKISIGQLVERLGIVNIELHTDRFDVIGISGDGFRPGISVINRFVFRSILDTRDRLPYPTKGRYVHFSYDLSSKLFNQQLSKDVSFFRSFFSIETYNTFAKRHTLNPKFTMGTADLTTPFVMHFRLNGYEHVFGTRDQELSGRHFILGNLTYRYELPKFLPVSSFLGLRYDIWGIWENTEKAVYNELNHSYGVFWGVDTFLGAIELAYGWTNTGQERIYFSVGQNF